MNKVRYRVFSRPYYSAAPGGLIVLE